MEGHLGEHQGWSEGRSGMRNVVRVFIVPPKEQVRQGKQV